MAQRDKPLVFGIGLPLGGGRVLADLFKESGYAWRHNLGGKLAVDLAFAQLSGKKPFQAWPGAAGFSGLHRSDVRHLPALHIQDSLSYLYATFPDAYFVRTHRNPVDWIAARYLDGAHRIAAARQAGIDEAQILDHWLAENEAHAAACHTLFAKCEKYMDFNVTTDPIDKLIDFFDPDFSLDRDADVADMKVSEETLQAAASHSAGLSKPSPDQEDMGFVADVIAFSMADRVNFGNPKALNGKSIHWPEKGVFLTPAGVEAPMAQRADGTVLIDVKSGLERAQGTIFEMMAHGAEPPLYIDMMDARFIGTEGHRTPPPRTVAYNRRQNAKNLTLWPLPAYHSLVPTETAGAFPADDIPFENKADLCVWRGNMTGRMSPSLTPDGRARRDVYALRGAMDNLVEEDPEGWDTVVSDLMCVPRYRVVKSLRDDPDFDVRFVLTDQWKHHADTPAFQGIATTRKARPWFHRFRYILSLSGNDTGSNFLPTAATNSLIFKEEDGWELFYTDAFKPWVHYVPLAEGAQDVVEKLAWARAHPVESAAMARASREMFDRFAEPANRAAILRGIAGRLNAAR